LQDYIEEVELLKLEINTQEDMHSEKEEEEKQEEE